MKNQTLDSLLAPALLKAYSQQMLNTSKKPKRFTKAQRRKNKAARKSRRKNRGVKTVSRGA